MISALLEFDMDEKVILTPTHSLVRCIVKKKNAAATEVLLHWSHLPDEKATWEDFAVVQHIYPRLLV